MDINVPLILFFLVVATGIGYLVDIFIYRKPRKANEASVESQYADMSDDEKSSSEVYQASMEAAQNEPVWIEYSKSFFPVLFIVFFLRSFIAEPFQIPSESMVPTLEVGDFIAVNKFAYGIRLPVIDKKIIPVSDPKRGDVMVFIPPHDPRYFIKRVVGLPGDKVAIVNNQLFINDEASIQTVLRREPSTTPGDRCPEYVVVNETFADHEHFMRMCSIPSTLGRSGSWVVPEGHYFMMGDNRDNSADSRVWSFVPEKNIVGKAFVKWMHWESFLSIPSFSRVGKIN